MTDDSDIQTAAHMAATAATAVTAPTVRKRRCWKRWLAWSTLTIICLLTVSYIFRVFFFGALIIGIISDTLSEASGCKVDIGSISGSWYADCTLSNIRISDEDGISPITQINCDSLSVEYNLLGMLSGFALDDIHALRAQSLHMTFDNEQALSESSDEPHEDVATPFLGFLSECLQNTIPDITIDGSIAYRSETDSIHSPLHIVMNDQEGFIDFADFVYNDLGLHSEKIILRRLDRQHFSIEGDNILPKISLSNGDLFCGNNTIDMHLPLRVHQQEILMSLHSDSNESHAHIHGNINWKNIPTWLHHIKPRSFPNSGQARIQASISVNDKHRNIDCIIDSKKLTWKIDNTHQIVCSGLIYYSCSNDIQKIELDHLQIHAPRHNVYINNPIRIHSIGANGWNINDSIVHIDKGTCQLSGHLDRDSSDFHIEWKDIDLGLLASAGGIDGLSGSSYGFLDISKDMNNPNLEASISLPQMNYQGNEFYFYAHIIQNKQGLNIIDITSQWNDQAMISCSGYWPQRLGTQGLQYVSGQHEDGEIYIDLEIPDLSVAPNAKGIFDSGRLALNAIISSHDHTTQATTTLTIHEATSPALEDISQQKFNATSTLTMNSQIWTLSSRLNQGPKHAISSTFTITPQSDILDPTTWQAFLANPLHTLVGFIDFENMHCKLRGSFPRIGKMNGKILFDNTKITFDDITAQLGFEDCIIGGNLTTDFQKIYQSSLHILGNNLLLVQSPGLMLRANCNLSLFKENPQDVMRVRGDVDISKCIYSAEFITTNRHVTAVDSQLQLFSLPQSFLGDALLDITIRGDESIELRSKMIHARASAHLHIGGTGHIPQPLGLVTIHQDARLTLPFSTIWFKESQIAFKEGEPFDPSFNINGHAKIQGYDLRVFVAGKMSEFSVNDIDVISNPPLSQEEATRLITTGVPPQSINELGNDIDTSGLVIGWAIVETLRKFFGNGDPQREKFFDSVSVEIGREVSDNGYNTIEVTIPLRNRLHFKVERDKYEDYNADLIWRFE